MQLLGAIVADYKSVRQAEVPLEGLTVLFGPNGAGKSNLIEAIGAHDPIARESLRRAGGEDRSQGARVGLVMRLNVDYTGLGPDAEVLREMLVSPWASGMAPLEITEGVGAYCGSSWWLYGGDLYDPSTQYSLPACYGVIRDALRGGVPASLQEDAERITDLLFDEPILIVQEDFAVYLSCDRRTAKGAELLETAQRAGNRLLKGALRDLSATLSSWTGRWPPLTTLTRGPRNEDSTPSGFGWVTERLGGVHVVSGDVDTVETHLERSLELAHDRLFHRLPGSDDDDPPGDEFCSVCLNRDHGGRVDPSVYEPSEGEDDSLPFLGSPHWLEDRDGWVRVRPTLREAIGVLEAEANRRLVRFVAEQGVIRLVVREIQEWDASAARCQIRFEWNAANEEPAVAGWDGPVGVAGFKVPQRQGMLTIPLADLGAGLRRWVATAVRLAAEACVRGEVEVVLERDVSPLPSTDDDWEILALSYQNAMYPRILLIDEPEQHLHPSAQHDIAAWCMEQAREHHAVLVATHSPAFFALPPQRVTMCQVLRRGYETQVKRLPEVHGPTAVARARELGFELGLGRDALAQLTRAVVVVEGEWDRELLYCFFGRELAEQRILVVPLQGADELGGLADAAVIPALGLPVVALLDEVRAATPEDLHRLTPPLSKAERTLKDLATALGATLRFVRYDDPDVICALPEAAVRAAYPAARFPGWDELLQEWRDEMAAGGTADSFKKWVLAAMGLPGSQRKPPSTFFRTVLAATGPTDLPSARFRHAARQLLSLLT